MKKKPKNIQTSEQYKHMQSFNERVSDVIDNFNRFEDFFSNQRPDVFYEGVKMDKKEILELVKEFFKTVKENDEDMWKDGIDSSVL